MLFDGLSLFLIQTIDILEIQRPFLKRKPIRDTPENTRINRMNGKVIYGLTNRNVCGDENPAAILRREKQPEINLKILELLIE